MSGFEDLAKKAGDFIGEHKDELDAALKSEQAEDISDKVLDGAEGIADKVTGGKFEGQIKGLRDAADGAIGNK